MTNQDVFTILAGIFLALSFIYIELRHIRKLFITQCRPKKSNDNKGGGNDPD
jgi:hypothetical protein